ncbi:alkaline ceramidase-like protein [Lindgomyces ingoldianus]|uniref:Alkaline ceramidase-like protein n=1 Tax=Lindgomyces ingoldianus TaxID=673940 RepID=A0ACB6Q862_9PLEO|nr:alkaline ceramidase-like protein [Lindgomyces ingoldianus]KAF2463199.1 alkaline ceramidase-like protein [Lindgomyces ingoldianus]
MDFLRRPYAQSPGTGVWGPPDSNQNFCEEDYVITMYIGEFMNTLTNLTYIIYGIHGIRRVQPREDGGLFSTLAFPYWGLVGVGILSGYYHATLKYHSQMGDDLSMLLAAGSILHQVLTFGAPGPQRLRTTLLLLGILIPISVYHCWADEILVHVLTFGIMVAIVGRKIRGLISQRVTNPDAKRRLGGLATMGMGSGLFGYFVWNIDMHFCSQVTAIKHRLGLPWGFLLELHGWWHILTGIGAYVGMALVEYLITMEEGKTDRVEEGFVWPVKRVLRDLEGREKEKKEKKGR